MNIYKILKKNRNLSKRFFSKEEKYYPFYEPYKADPIVPVPKENTPIKKYSHIHD